MKKLMILGASTSQLPLIYAAKKSGIYTIAASTPGDWPGFEAADAFTYTDISDEEAVLAEAKRMEIDGIVTCCMDTGVRAIGRVCETMGLSGPSKIAAKTTTDKYKMKEAFQKNGVSCARHICVKNEMQLLEAMEELAFPIVIKAVDLMGSRGIFRCDTKQEALKNYKKSMEATQKEYCLVEEFVEGTLFGAEAMIQNGKMVFCMLDNTESYPGYVPTPVGHSVPFEQEKNLGNQAREQVAKAVRAVGLDNCAVNCDLIYKEGMVYVIEITARAGATCLPEITGLYYGINYYEAIVKLALGMDVAPMFHRQAPQICSIARSLTSSRDGVVKSIANHNLPDVHIVDISLYLKPGDFVCRYTNGRDRLGQIIIKGDTLPDCRRRLDEVLAKINIEFV